MTIGATIATVQGCSEKPERMPDCLKSCDSSYAKPDTYSSIDPSSILLSVGGLQLALGNPSSEPKEPKEHTRM